MPLTHTRTFRVRYYECDGYGHVSNANYLRYMQEAAFDASTAAGYGPAAYSEMDRIWLIRETDIEYLQPLRHGDSVEVKTWVVDFHRVRSRRAYEMRNAATGDLVAKAMTDWVFLELSTMRPVAIPPEMAAGFWPEGAPPEVPPRKKRAAPPPPPPGVFVLRQKVDWGDIDPMKHVNNSAYIRFMDNAAFEVGRAHGWPAERYLREGFGVHVHSHHIEYKQAAVMDDELEISTWVSELRRVSAIRHYAIRRASDQELLISASSKVAWINLETGRPSVIPDNFIEDFKPNIVGLAE